MSGRHEIQESHHLFFPPSNYTGHEWYEESRERNIVLMRRVGHIGLHKAVEPPPKPTLEMMADYLDAYEIASPNQGLESFEFTEEYFAYNYIHYMGVENLQEMMLGIANNVARQLSWVKGNLVE